MLDYDREAARYDATRGGDARAQAAADAIETLLTGLEADPARIVDVGCGTGIVTARLAQPAQPGRPGRSVAGVDRSGGMAAVAATRLPGRITLGDGSRLPLGRESVDVVTMVWLLHLLNPADSASALAEAARVLRSGGLLITTVGKDDAAYGEADDATAIIAPVRARFGHDPTDRLERVLDLGERLGLALTAQTTFVGLGQGMSPRRWCRQLRGDGHRWTAAAGRERVEALCAALGRLPDQDRLRPEPVYQLVALRQGGR